MWIIKSHPPTRRSEPWFNMNLPGWSMVELKERKERTCYEHPTYNWVWPPYGVQGKTKSQLTYRALQSLSEQGLSPPLKGLLICWWNSSSKGAVGCFLPFLHFTQHFEKTWAAATPPSSYVPPPHSLPPSTNAHYNSFWYSFLFPRGSGWRWKLWHPVVVHCQSLLSVYGYLCGSWMYYNAVDPQQTLFQVGVRGRLRFAEGENRQVARPIISFEPNDMIGQSFHRILWEWNWMSFYAWWISLTF